MSLSLSLLGLRVVAVARRKARLEELQHAMHAAGVSPGAFLPVVCDITKDAEVRAISSFRQGLAQLP